jgi:hypothetical protein
MFPYGSLAVSPIDGIVKLGKSLRVSGALDQRPHPQINKLGVVLGGEDANKLPKLTMPSAMCLLTSILREASRIGPTSPILQANRIGGLAVPQGRWLRCTPRVLNGKCYLMQSERVRDGSIFEFESILGPQKH